MICIISESLDPHFNIAAEELLLKTKEEEVFMLWRSEPCVVVGKHQNTLAEINYPYLLENKLKLARRISGGGTVVHDLGNLNFTFIANGEKGKLVDFKKFVQPVVNYLRTLGVPAEIGGKNDIRVNNLKVSGNAEHVYKNRVLHHGTLLFNSDLEQLKQAIKVRPGLYRDKAVQSNRAHVTNIIDLLGKKINIEEFTQELMQHVAGGHKQKLYSFSHGELKKIETLRLEKYLTKDWIFAYSPKYEFEQEIMLEQEWLKLYLKVEKGLIVDMLITDKENQECYQEVPEALIGVKHRMPELAEALLEKCPSFYKSYHESLSIKFF